MTLPLFPGLGVNADRAETLQNFEPPIPLRGDIAEGAGYVGVIEEVIRLFQVFAGHRAVHPVALVGVQFGMAPVGDEGFGPGLGFQVESDRGGKIGQ